MAGPNLELFKFSLYLFFPLAIMIHYGDPQWYHDNVLPFRDQFWPDNDKTYKPPRTVTDVRAAVEEMRQKRLRAKGEGVATGPVSALLNRGAGRDVVAPAVVPGNPSLRPEGSTGRFSTMPMTGLRTPTSASWRESWPEAQRGRVV